MLFMFTGMAALYAVAAGNIFMLQTLNDQVSGMPPSQWYMLHRYHIWVTVGK